ncbi:MAG: hypothetical protein KGI82_00420 [Betaproteobacteria bacterium]|nr:hypothetical protein [Betaproteobacteria bacterium]
MAYTLINPSTIPLQPNEVQFTLDTGQSVAVRARVSRLGNGSTAFDADARVLDAKGETALDGNGHPIQSSARFTLDAATANSVTPTAAKKDAVLLVLGETPLVLTSFSKGQTESWSLRSAISAAAHAGPVTDLAGTF